MFWLIQKKHTQKKSWIENFVDKIGLENHIEKCHNRIVNTQLDIVVSIYLPIHNIIFNKKKFLVEKFLTERLCYFLFIIFLLVKRVLVLHTSEKIIIILIHSTVYSHIHVSEREKLGQRVFWSHKLILFFFINEFSMFLAPFLTLYALCV